MSSKSAPKTSTRLDGLDVARLLAFAGMVVVNFRVAMGASDGPAWLNAVMTACEGKAAGLFVVLAGVGLALAGQRAPETIAGVTIRRAAFLLAVGLLNATIFDADILHFYAFYFVLGALCLRWSTRALAMAALALAGLFVVLFLPLDYEKEWNWETLTYAGFWTLPGFARHVFFNGWHPVVPWAAFLLYGLILGRLRLGERATQLRLVAIGGTVALLTELVSWGVVALLSESRGYEDAHALFGTSPILPTPPYLLTAAGTASAVIGLCLLAAPALRRARLLGVLVPAGRQTLTLYVAHILVGMGTLEALGLLSGASLTTSALAAALFSAAAVVYAWLWSRFSQRGPLEALMRRLAG